MLKDLINKNVKKSLNKKAKEDKIKFPIADGFVDIKGYDKDGKMFYHDCGDNVVTDWMRHAIILMLGGVSFSNKGNKPSVEKHGDGRNEDGYLFNNKQFGDSMPNNLHPYVKPLISGYDNALFPTKILLGTGKEYSDWSTLKSENEAENQTWYKTIVETFGAGAGEGQAQQTFEKHIDDDNNSFSGTITNGVNSGNGSLTKCRTVNDIDSVSKNIATSTAMYKNYNVVGAIKTSTQQEKDPDRLESRLSPSGILEKAEFRGIGNPCFIYLDRDSENPDTEKWDQEANGVTISKEEGNRYLTKITFSVSMPTQEGKDAGKFYPYNGYSLKQIGLYNDAVLQIKPNQSISASDDNYYPGKNMDKGMLLAVKNIQPFTKSAGGTYKITWTLTI